MAKPKPVHKLTVCDQCGLPWDKHTQGRKTDPTTDDCVQLLRAELAKRPYQQMQFSGSNGYVRLPDQNFC